MRAFWFLSSNFGDALTPIIVERITGKSPDWVAAHEERPHLVGVGSILNHARSNAIAWGSGIASMADQINAQADIRLVRGPLSAMRVVMSGGKAINNFGDPALLCPQFFCAGEKKYDLGFVPHYVDQSHWPGLADAKRINVLNTPERVIREITECRAIISSSLHGLIVADAYGIPAAWLHSPRLEGDGTKFADHFLAVSGKVMTPLIWEEIANLTTAQLIERIQNRSVAFDANAILESFPRDLE